MLAASLLVLVTAASAASFDPDGGTHGMISQPVTEIPLPESIEQVLSIIRTVEKLPLCPKIATAALVHSCSGMEESSSTNIDHLFEQSKTVYAARLAVCELQDAFNPVPNECLSFVPTRENTRKQSIYGWLRADGPTEPITRFQDYEVVTEKNIQQCLTALGTKAQWWTSYSNNRQTAVVMCHAMSASVKKDETLAMYRVLTEVNSKATDALLRSTELFEQSENDFDQIRKSMQSFHKALVSDFEGMTDAVAQFWTALDNKVGQIANDLDNIDQTTQRLGSNLEKKYQDLSDQAKGHMNDLTSIRVQNAEIHEELLETFADTEMSIEHMFGALVENLTDFDAQVVHMLRTFEHLNATMSELPTMSNVIQAMGDRIWSKLAEGSALLMHYVMIWSFAWAILNKWGYFSAAGTLVASIGLACFLEGFSGWTDRVSSTIFLNHFVEPGSSTDNLGPNSLVARDVSIFAQSDGPYNYFKTFLILGLVLVAVCTVVVQFRAVIYRALSNRHVAHVNTIHPTIIHHPAIMPHPSFNPSTIPIITVTPPAPTAVASPPVPAINDSKWWIYQQQRNAERLAATARDAAARRQAIADRQAAAELQAAVDLQAANDLQAAINRQAAADRRATADSEAAVDSQAAADTQVVAELQAADDGGAANDGEAAADLEAATHTSAI